VEYDHGMAQAQPARLAPDLRNASKPRKMMSYSWQVFYEILPYFQTYIARRLRSTAS
jgi:hypothetical protein